METARSRHNNFEKHSKRDEFDNRLLHSPQLHQILCNPQRACNTCNIYATANSLQAPVASAPQCFGRSSGASEPHIMVHLDVSLGFAFCNKKAVKLLSDRKRFGPGFLGASMMLDLQRAPQEHCKQLSVSEPGKELMYVRLVLLNSAALCKISVFAHFWLHQRLTFCTHFMQPCTLSEFWVPHLGECRLALCGPVAAQAYIWLYTPCVDTRYLGRPPCYPYKISMPYMQHQESLSNRARYPEQIPRVDAMTTTLCSALAEGLVCEYLRRHRALLPF